MRFDVLFVNHFRFVVIHYMFMYTELSFLHTSFSRSRSLAKPMFIRTHTKDTENKSGVEKVTRLRQVFTLHSFVHSFRIYCVFGETEWHRRQHQHQHQQNMHTNLHKKQINFYRSKIVHVSFEPWKCDQKMRRKSRNRMGPRGKARKNVKNKSKIK